MCALRRRNGDSNRVRRLTVRNQHQLPAQHRLLSQVCVLCDPPPSQGASKVLHSAMEEGRISGAFCSDVARRDAVRAALRLQFEESLRVPTARSTASRERSRRVTAVGAGHSLGVTHLPGQLTEP